MSAVRTLSVAVSALVCLTTAPLVARQGPALDPAALSGFTWRPLGLDGLQLTHVATDAAFPYRVCAEDTAGLTRCLSAGSEESSRSWSLVAIDGDGPLTPDTIDADVFYTGSLRRFDRRTGQATFVSPVLADQLRGREARAALAFSADGRTLFAALHSVWRTTNAGQSWTPISPELAPAPGRISVVAASPIDARVIWAGTTSGTVHLTRDAGTTWVVVTPADIPTGSDVSGLEPSRFDPQSAYVSTRGQGAALWRTRDHGASWKNVSLSLPLSASVGRVREDLFRRGLLFAATGASLFFSIDDGESWQPLRNNLPDTAISDIALRDADLVVATAGRGVWVLNDFSPLRQITADVIRADAFLFRPAQTWRVRASATSAQDDGAWNADGVALSYLVGQTLTGPLQLEVIETATGDVIRRYSSEPSGRQPGDPLLSRQPGLQRIVWDLRYARPEADPAAPPGARVLPGTYQVRLTSTPRSIRQSVAVRLDPRIRTATTDLAAQRTLARALDERRAEIAEALGRVSGAAETPASTSAVVASLVESRNELRRIAMAVNDTDARPSGTLEAAATAAMERAKVAVEAAVSVR